METVGSQISNHWLEDEGENPGEENQKNNVGKNSQERAKQREKMPDEGNNTKDSKKANFRELAKTHGLIIAVMKIKFNEWLAGVYADLFDWPLTGQERQRWVIGNDASGKEIRIDKARQEKLWRQRKLREEKALQKCQKAVAVTKMLAKIPTIEGIFLTGSVAVGNAEKNSDIDLMIVTTAGSLWITRAIVVTFLKWQGLYKKIICPNIFLDTDHLEIKEKNLYTAHEVLQARCLFDRGEIKKLWLVKNSWTKGYLSNAYRAKTKEMLESPSMTSFWLVQNLLWPFEFLAFIFQYLYMKPKMTNEKIGWGYAFFHPSDLSERVVRQFMSRVGLLSAKRNF